MKQLLHQYAACNLLANKIMTGQINQLTEEQVNKKLPVLCQFMIDSGNSWDSLFAGDNSR